MAKLSFDGFDEVEKLLLHEAERAKRNGAAALKAGADIAKAEMQTRIREPKGTTGHSGHLKDNITITDVSYSAMDGYSLDIYPNGVRDDGQRYATVGFVLEYGRSNMKARPWMKPAVKAKHTEIQNAIIEELKK